MKSYLWAFGLAVALALVSGCVTEEQTKMKATPYGEKTTVYGKALDKAQDSVCDGYVSQLQQGVMIYQQSNDGKLPPDLAAVMKATGFSEAAVAPCKYAYDPNTGKVTVVR